MVIAIVSLLISILVPALSRAREVSQRTVCASNLRQWGTVMLQYADSNDGWLPCKALPSADAPVCRKAQVQEQTSVDYGPYLTGIVRDVIEKVAGREGGTPRYLQDTKVMLCPSDRHNNPPGYTPPPHPSGAQTWRTEPVRSFADLPRTFIEYNNRRRTYISYLYIAMWRNDDRGDFLLMADQSNRNDIKTTSFTQLDQEDNHGVRGLNWLLLDSHVEWAGPRSGGNFDMGQLSNRFWGPIIATRARWPDTASACGGGQPVNRSWEVESLE